MKKNILSLVVFIIIYSCNIKNNKPHFENQLHAKGEVYYCDVDLFSFTPIICSEETNPKMTIQNGDSVKIITVFNGNHKYIKKYKKNKEGLYTEIDTTNLEENNPGYLTMFYRVYSKNKIITFNVSKFGGDKKMNIHNYSVLYPVEKDNEQFEYYYNDLSGKKVSNFEQLDYENILAKDISTPYDHLDVYKYDYSKKVRFWYSIIKNEKYTNEIYKIGNSKSIASPIYNTWKPVD